ncbi:hypothetical protein [Cohnella kolymensis]|uniref:hypothetical protein n=1 Tax=Cohnella kolymensis TaxID=1590652 RepID=UPI0013793285|nr:hypothetical protein [Cohnella kolymensis]
MEGQNSEAPMYYDGSKHMAAAAEQSVESVEEQAPSASEEWRRYIGFNPFGSQD